MNKHLASYFGMTKRNVLVFIKDKATLFFSMLAPLIVLFLYLFFLKSNYLSAFTSNMDSLEGLVTDKDINAILNAWLLAGVLGTSCITVALNSLGVMVADKEARIDYDYNASPVNGKIVVLSYFTGAFLNTIVITLSVLVIGLIVLALSGPFPYQFVDILKMFFYLIINCLSSVLIMMVIVSFFKKANTFGVFGGIVSAAIGFLIGAYIPISEFSNKVQFVANTLPASQGACLLRGALMNPFLNDINMGINGIDGGAFMISMNEAFSLELNFFNNFINEQFMIIYVVCSVVVFLALDIFIYRFTSKRK